MKKITILLLCLLGLTAVISSCNDDETYADKLKKEPPSTNILPTAM